MCGGGAEERDVEVNVGLFGNDGGKRVLARGSEGDACLVVRRCKDDGAVETRLVGSRGVDEPGTRWRVPRNFLNLNHP